MTTQLVVTKYEDPARGVCIDVNFTEDGWFNATEIAAQYDKRPTDWLKLDSTKNYLPVLAGFLKCEESSLLKSKRGRYSDGTWLHPKLAVAFARWLDTRFAVWCDLQIDMILRGTHPHNDWRRLRHEAASSYKVMSAILQTSRLSAGKTTAPHHFANEAKLVNWALTGEFKPLDRDGLTLDELNILAALEEHNAVFLGIGMNRDTRKLALEGLVADWRSKHVKRLN